MVYYTERLKEIREEKGVTQRAIAALLEIKHPQYNRYETGKTAMTVEMFRKICVALDISSEYLLGFTDEKRPLK